VFILVNNAEDLNLCFIQCKNHSTLATESPFLFPYSDCWLFSIYSSFSKCFEKVDQKSFYFYSHYTGI